MDNHTQKTNQAHEMRVTKSAAWLGIVLFGALAFMGPMDDWHPVWLAIVMVIAIFLLLVDWFERWAAKLTAEIESKRRL